MNLCGLALVCFPGVRINERFCASAEEERAKGKEAEMGWPGEVRNHGVKHLLGLQFLFLSHKIDEK